MDAQLEELIARMEGAMADPNARPLWLHWSDVTLLRALQTDRIDQAVRLDRLKAAVTAELFGGNVPGPTITDEPAAREG